MPQSEQQLRDDIVRVGRLMYDKGWIAANDGNTSVLPNGPAGAKWLTAGEKDWIAEQLAADEAALGPPRTHSLRAALSHPLVWQLGLSNLFILGAGNTFLLSAPAVLQGATHWTTGAVGLVVGNEGV